METVNNVVNSASKLIWGEGATQPGEEPVSGQKGAGTADEPYDKGNTTSETPSAITNPSSTMSSDTNNTNPSTNDPGTAAHSTSQPAGQKHEGADRPTEEPNAQQTEAIAQKSDVAESQQAGQSGSETGEHHPITDEEREKLAEKGELPKLPNDHSGEPMHTHGNSAEKTETEGESGDPRTEGKTERSKSVAHEGGGQHGKQEGTGEQWVKTSGLAADGGDFDATKPGAGREANRILEDKGIKKDDSGKMTTDDGSSPDLGGGGNDVKKESKIAKLKEKLHIGSGKHT